MGIGHNRLAKVNAAVEASDKKFWKASRRGREACNMIRILIGFPMSPIPP